MMLANSVEMCISRHVLKLKCQFYPIQERSYSLSSMVLSLHSPCITEPVFNCFVSCTKNLVFLVTKRKKLSIPNVYSNLNFFLTFKKGKKKKGRKVLW